VLEAVRAHATPICAADAAAAGTSEVEVLWAIKHSAPGRAPGPDGMPPEFWRWCSGALLAAVSTAIETGQLPTGFSTGLVLPPLQATGRPLSTSAPSLSLEEWRLLPPPYQGPRQALGGRPAL